MKINWMMLGAWFGVLFLIMGAPVNAGEVENPRGHYVVQLNAFTIESNASNFIKKWKTKGFPVFLEHDEGERWFKIRVGPYSNWEEARQVSLKLKKEKLSPLVLLTLPEEKEPTSADGVLESEEYPESDKKAPDLSGPEKVTGGENPVESDVVDRVVARFMGWKAAWEEKNLPAYLRFYSPDFDSGPKSQKAWERSRAIALSREGTITIDVAEVQILPEGKQVEMSFIQKFRSSRFSDVGHKTIVWRLENGDWHIVSERWLPI